MKQKAKGQASMASQAAAVCSARAPRSDQLEVAAQTCAKPLDVAEQARTLEVTEPAAIQSVQSQPIRTCSASTQTPTRRTRPPTSADPPSAAKLHGPARAGPCAARRPRARPQSAVQALRPPEVKVTRSRQSKSTARPEAVVVRSSRPANRPQTKPPPTLSAPPVPLLGYAQRLSAEVPVDYLQRSPEIAPDYLQRNASTGRIGGLWGAHATRPAAESFESAAETPSWHGHATGESEAVGQVEDCEVVSLDRATLQLERLVEETHHALVRDGLIKAPSQAWSTWSMDVKPATSPFAGGPSLDAVDRALEELQRGLEEIDSALARPYLSREMDGPGF